ncbi:MAG: hypothetical protein EOM84_02555 [Sphingobacteriia bacterium]|nr:hypothetical protein [Sphingobacteriia bacterium]
MGITAEIQKGHIYYRCTKKSKQVKCAEPFVREEKLDKQISSLLQKFSLSAYWSDKLLEMLEKDKNDSAQYATAFVQDAKEKISKLNLKLQRLLDSYLDQDIEREIYLKKKAQFLSEKKSLEEKIQSLEQKRTGWVEPMENWIKEARNLPKIAREGNLFSKKVAAKEIFGSNLILSERKASATPQKQWRLLPIATEKFAGKPESLKIVALRGIEPLFTG